MFRGKRESVPEDGFCESCFITLTAFEETWAEDDGVCISEARQG
jgi:hypothetical protein